MQFRFFLSVIILCHNVAFAEPSKAHKISKKNSRCSVDVSGGEYPVYKILKGRKVIYAPVSDGIVNALISPDGKYVALGAGEIDLVEGFGVMIINCDSEHKKGYWIGKPTSLKEWTKDKLILTDGEISFSGAEADSLPL